MREPELPMTKSALDRLGTRLAAGNRVSNADLEKLAAVAAVCQRVLNEAKAELATLGYQATTRVKTTGTLVEKLRRESARLSQVQDLAGARIIVPHRPAQDDALVKIRNHFEASGHRCREIDRRKDPRYGYRAVHLVVAVGPILIEIQVRTELEDTWAQIVERLSDVLRDIAARGVTILLVEQNARLALEVATRAAVIEQGRIVHQGVASELATDPVVADHYFGRAEKVA